MSADARQVVADLLVERLHQYGVDVVFGYPGGQLTPIYDALYRFGKIRHILSRHEQASAFMADGYARATGRPGVCLAVCGPGVYNAATPLAAAHTDSIPLLLLSGQVPRAGLGLRSGYYHENDQLKACASFTVKQIRADQPEKILEALDQAWTALTSGRPGPVILEIPVDVLRTEVDLRVPDKPPAMTANQTIEGDLPSALQALTECHRPVILAGGGVLRAGAERQLVDLAERLGAPVFHTANGKTAIPGSHPLCAGMPWRCATSDLSRMQEFFSPLWSEADLVLAVGCRFSQLATGNWTLPLPARRIHIDIDPEEIGRHYPVNISLLGDAGHILSRILAQFPREPRHPWSLPQAGNDGWRLPGLDLIGVLSRCLPPEILVAADVTRLAYMMMVNLPLHTPRSFLHPAGAVAMGYGIPAALGARAAFPNRPVLAVVGDGGFQMSAMELASSMQERLPIVILLVNDQCLTLIKSSQERHYNRRYIAVDLENPDFEQFARSFGVQYQQPQSEEELEKVLCEGFKAPGTTLVEVRPNESMP